MKKLYIKLLLWIVAIVSFLVVFFSFAFYTREKYIEIYNDGVSLLEAGKYMEAVERFNDIPNYINYRDIEELIIEYNIDFVCPHCGKMLIKTLKEE